MLINFLLILVAAMFLSYFLIAYIKSISHKYKILAKPRSDRWHNKPIPIHGSFGFYSIFIFLVLFTLSVYSPDINNLRQSQEILITPVIIKQITFVIALLGSSLLFFIFGFIDDLVNMRPKSRLIFQIIVCSLFIFDTNMFLISEIEVFNFIYTLFWFIGIINAINLIDSFDGVSSGTVVIASLVFLALIVNQGDFDGSFYFISITTILIGVLIGYLIHNFPPATIFMGDSGSLSIGFLIAATLVPSESNNYLGLEQAFNIKHILYPCLILSFPIFDTALVTLSRIMNGKKFYEGGKDHTAHRFSIIGFSDRKVLFICLAYSIFSGSLVLITEILTLSAELIFLIFFSINIFLLTLMLKVKTYN